VVISKTRGPSVETWEGNGRVVRPPAEYGERKSGEFQSGSTSGGKIGERGGIGHAVLKEREESERNGEGTQTASHLLLEENKKKGQSKE